MAENNTRRQRKKKRSALYAPLSFVVICAALVFGLSVFFKVSNITVSGASLYSQQEIIDASGVETGDNLFFVNRFTAASRIKSKLPYVDNVTVTRKLPNTIVIGISESQGLAAVSSSGKLWVVDASCKILQETTMAERGDGIITVTGITPTAPTLGELLVGSAEDAGKVAYLAELLTAVQKWDMASDISAIDMSNISSPQFDYLNRFTVKMGSYENVDYKVELLLSAVKLLAEGDSGTIDLSLSADNKAHFSPD